MTVDRDDELRELHAEDNPDGAELLDDVEAFLARFVVYPSEHERRAHVLWIAHCWFMQYWDSTPRIAFLSPEPGSGKSRALEVTEPLVPRPVHAVNCTPAYLFRKVSDPDGAPTILYDECDTLFGPKAKEHEEIRGMINAGHRKGAIAGRCVVRGKVVETEELPAYCAVMLAGLDDLPDTIMSRSVVSRMRRRAPNEPVEPWRQRINGTQAAVLNRRLHNWSSNVKPLEKGWPDMPATVTDRDADIWEALLAVADVAGGHWPKSARVAAVTLVTASRDRKPSIGVLLLEHLRTVFERSDHDKMATTDILAALNKMDEAPWATIRRGEALDPRGLASRLGKYGIGSKAHRIGDDVIKGYSRAQFQDAWSRYLDHVDETALEREDSSVTPVTHETSHVKNGFDRSTFPVDVTDHRLQGDRDQIQEHRLSSGETGVTGVTASAEADQASPGAPTPRTPGQTERMNRALAAARVNNTPQICPSCRRAPARFDTQLCDFCTAKAS
ncbi:DUF3631 domain-containing protein [Mycobacterium intracellulare]|nr:DUF3631 domain-containing protein [Mycobacterium intracellulare]